MNVYGFGAAGHIVAQVARWQGRAVFAFTRPNDLAAQSFARGLGVNWAGGSDEMPPEPLDVAIIYATLGDLIPLALKAVRKGGRVVCAGIHMSDIPSFPYDLLWNERQILSVANLTRRDGSIFCNWRRKSASTQRPRLTPWSEPTRRSPIFAAGVSPAPRCWFPAADCSHTKNYELRDARRVIWMILPRR